MYYIQNQRHACALQIINLLYLIVPWFVNCKILGHMKIDSSTLMLFTVLKNLQGLGYMLKVRFLPFSAILLVFSLLPTASNMLIAFIRNIFVICSLNSMSK